MARYAIILACAAFIFSASACAASPPEQARPAAAASAEDVSAPVQAQLDDFVVSYLQSSNLALRPGKASPEIRTRDGKVVSTYIEMDPNSATTELRSSNNGSFSYLAKLTYLEHTYEAVADSPEEAINGVYVRIKSRRLTEFPRYVRGAWHN